MINPELKVGDKVILLHMEGEMMSPGSKGTVLSVGRDPFEKDEVIYSVRWDDGSQLSLLSVTDAWKLDESKQIKESNIDNFKWMISNSDIIKYFDTKLLTDYLVVVRDSGITNMFGASPYLYLGKERIEHEFKYKNIPDEEKFEELLSMADSAQRAMINGTIKVLENEKKEVTPESVNRLIQRYAPRVLNYWMKVF